MMSKGAIKVVGDQEEFNLSDQEEEFRSLILGRHRITLPAAHSGALAGIPLTKDELKKLKLHKHDQWMVFLVASYVETLDGAVSVGMVSEYFHVSREMHSMELKRSYPQTISLMTTNEQIPFRRETDKKIGFHERKKTHPA